MAHTFPLLNVEVRTPRLTLAGASDELLERLVPLVRAGVADAEPWPFDDPISFYADSPEREWQWLRGVWAGRARVSPDSWRLYFAVLADGEPVGMQDLIGTNFTRFGTVSSFSWLAPGSRGQGLGKEMWAAILQLAFAGLGAREAGSDAFVDNEASNRISRGLGYERADRHRRVPARPGHRLAERDHCARPDHRMIDTSVPAGMETQPWAPPGTAGHHPAPAAAMTSQAGRQCESGENGYSGEGVPG